MGERRWLLIEEFWQSFRIADALDIALVSIVLYTILVWFRTTASRSVAVGVSLLAVFYFAARLFDLYLTSLAFQTAFAALLVGLVVIFQEDMRRMLERLATLGSLGQLKQPVNLRPIVDLLVEAVFHLAESRTGALIALKGREPLGRHLDGGIVLDGRLSKPLLYSIFDPSSAGHDGAVVLAHDRVTLFGAHLPISKNQQEIRGRGTRHSAAVGLSEQSDALVVVVSEERGAVSVAQQGKLTVCETASALKGHVEDFYEQHFPQHPSATRAMLSKHWPLKVIALLMAVLAWFVFAYQPHTIQRTFVAPVEYRNVPQSLILDELAASEVRITLSGAERAFRFFDPGSLKVTVDLSGNRAGTLSIVVTDNEVRVPTNLNIYRIEPRILYVTLRDQQPDRVPELLK
jgi:diadenylate cyclase